MRLLVKYPTRWRPDLFRSTFRRYLDYLARPDLARVVVSVDDDDETMSVDDVLDLFGEYQGRGTSFTLARSKGPRTKVQAINADIPDDDSWDVLLVASDDMIPQLKWYDDVIRADMAKHYPDTDGCLWYPDGRRPDLWTLPVVGRKYYARTRSVYHPAYESVFADNEAQEVAQRDGRLTRMSQVLCHHQWRAVTAEDDALYARNDSPLMYLKDKHTYALRRVAGFPIEWAEDSQKDSGGRVPKE